MRLIKYILTGFFGLLFGCSSKEVIDKNVSKHFARDKNDGKVYYKYYQGGAWIATYLPINTKYPKRFNPLSLYYASDGKAVFYQDKVLNKVKSKHFNVADTLGDFFGVDTKKKKIYYTLYPLNLDFKTAKILGKNHVLDKEKVLFKKKNDSTFNTIIPVNDLKSFQIYSKKHENILAFDKTSWYLNELKLQVPYNNTIVIKDSYVKLIQQNDKLHLITTPFRNNEKIPPQLQLKPIEKLEFSKYNTQQHYLISGFKNLLFTKNKQWFTDDNGLYFNKNEKISKVYDGKITGIKEVNKKNYLGQHKFLRTNQGLFFSNGYIHKRFTNKATIFDKTIVVDNNKVYQEGKEEPHVDAKTLFNLKTYPTACVDKNLLYVGGILKYNYAQAIPSWAYNELKTGKLKWGDLFFQKTTKAEEIKKTYWNGFLVTVYIPNKYNTSTTIRFVFKNIERKTITLDKPIEDLIHLFYESALNRPRPFEKETTKLKPMNRYNYKDIKNDALIEFTYTLNDSLIKKFTLKNYSQPIMPFLIIRSKDNLLEENNPYELKLTLMIEKKNNP